MAIRRRPALPASADALPHHGAVITSSAICGLPHRRADEDIAGVMVVPVRAPIVVIALGSLSGSS